MSEGIQVGVKNLIYTKTGYMYRYTLVVYRYTLATASLCVGCTGTLWRVYRYTLATVHFCIRCTGTPVPFFFLFFLFIIFYYIFLQIGNSGADVKFVFADCLPFQVLLHAHLSFDHNLPD